MSAKRLELGLQARHRNGEVLQQRRTRLSRSPSQEVSEKGKGCDYFWVHPLPRHEVRPLGVMLILHKVTGLPSEACCNRGDEGEGGKGGSGIGERRWGGERGEVVVRAGCGLWFVVGRL